MIPEFSEVNRGRTRESKADLELGLEHLKLMYEQLEPLLHNKMALDKVVNDLALELEAQKARVEHDLKIKQQYEDLLDQLKEIVDRAVKNLKRKEDQAKIYDILEQMKKLSQEPGE